MQLDEKSLETIAIAISIAAGCEPCTRYHLKAAAELGSSGLEMMQMVALAGAIRNDRTPVAMAIDEIRSMAPSDGALDRHAVLAGIGIAVCVNGVRPLRENVEVARSAGVTDEEIMEVIGLAARIKEKAASHLDRIIGRLDADPGVGRAVASLCT